MIKYRAILKKPNEEPVFVYYSNSLKFLDGQLEGPPSALKVTTSEGKKISIFYTQEAVMKRKDYNFTLMVVPDKRKYWLDFCGNVIVFGRDENDNLLDCPLSIEEAEEIFQVPYDR